MKKSTIISILIIVVIACVCFFCGYNKAIKDAQLIEATNDTYYIQFGNDIHEYTFD